MEKDSTIASTNRKRPQRTAQAHQPIGSVHEGQISASTNRKRPRRTSKHINQSEASTKDITSASTNQKRPRGTAQAHQPIRSVHKGQLSVRTNHIVFTKQRRRRSSNQIRLAGSIGGRLVTPEGSIGPSQSDSSVGLSSDGLSSGGLSSEGLSLDRPSIKSESSDQPTRSIDRSISVGLSSDGLSPD